MYRRKFLQQTIGAGAAAFTASSLTAQPTANKLYSTVQSFKLLYGIHDGMFKNSAGNDFLDQIQFAYDNGFRAIEDNGLMGRPVTMQTKIGEKLAKLGMTMGVFVIDKGGNGANTLAAAKQEYVDIFLKGCKQATEVAKRVNATWATVVPGDYYNNVSVSIQTANVIEALKQGAAILEPHNLIMVLEPLSDTPELMLRTSDQTYLICKAVNSSSCKILFDMYHMQRNEGDIMNNIDRTYDEIAYFQIGDNPGRNEPTTGEMNYKNIFKHIYSKGYKGVLGMEHGNSVKGAAGEEVLMKAYRYCDDF